MPIRISESLPSKSVLEKENIFVMGLNRALSQDIRPLKILLLNIMPTKETTETQFLRLLSNSPLQVDVVLMRLASHKSKNTSEKYLETFYKTFDEVRGQKWDGMIITGAPVEDLPFEQVDYWNELKEIISWSKQNVYSTMYVCWGAQAGLYCNYGIPKYKLPQKMFGVFNCRVTRNNIPLFRGFDDQFRMPHSRYTEVHQEDILKHSDLEIVSVSPEAGICVVMAKDGREIYIFGHGEYDSDTLKKEYDRDIAKGIKINVPKNYFIDDDPSKSINVSWRAHYNLLYCNWLNYYVYQVTPYEIDRIQK